ncbi:hypothetical protein CPC16_002612 [Podila verticillata]|nr:hypothetical protein BGZ52_012540 [Haplosporangium bisporale]KAF9212788.1 hypothetical protein BGZ59_006323 [Podila verticillata]KAF9393177.1 hypothetical protein CPC16_002612 [Podila verticillata]KFH68214.1 hypothetical protein MVEG_05033 [Podila verticillata NRRL 6337]
MLKSTISLILACLALLSIVAAQAQCGPGAGSCTEGNCCSAAGFCGNTSVYCSTGCQVGFGLCDSPSSSGAISPPATTLSPIGPTVSTTETILPSTTIVTATTTIATVTTTTITTTTTTTSSETSTGTSPKGTYQLQPTGKPSGASAQDKGVKSTVALVVVFIAGLFMI